MGEGGTMDKYSSKELAFFSIMETALNFNLIEEKTSFHITIDELVEKLGMNKAVIEQHLINLDGLGFLKLKENNGGSYVLDLSKSRTKLYEVFSQQEIDRLLKDFDNFIKKYNLVEKNEKLKSYVALIKNELVKNINCDINYIIKKGIEEIFDDEEIVNLEKELYNLCEIIHEDDMEVIEVVLFCLYNFKKTDNPFLVTLFLASIYKLIEK